MEAPASARRGTGTRTNRWLLAGGLFLVVLVVYVRSPVVTVTDSVWVIPTAMSLLDDHDADLSEYRGAIDALHGWQLVTTPDGRVFYKVPVASSLVVLPAVAVARALDPQIDADVRAGRPTTVEPILASVIVAATAVVVLLTALAGGASDLIAVTTALVFAFATSAWSTASRALWMHGPSMLVVALALYCLVRVRGIAAGRRAGLVLAGAGGLLALAFFIRPTNAVVAASFGVYVLVTRRRRAVPFIAGAAGVTAAFLLLDLALYGSVLPDYFRSDRLALSSTVPGALAGNLVSPARGLLVYSPVLVFAVVGFVRLRRAGTMGGAPADDGLELAVVAAVVAQVVVVSLFPHWWAGWSYGPRFLCDVLPLIVWLLPPALVGLRARPAELAAFSILLAWSVLVHARGATDVATFEWNTTPVNVDLAPERLWDWSDPPFLR